VTITDAAIDLLTEKGFSPTYGARFLKRHIDEKVKLPLTTTWKLGSRFTVDAQDGDITVTPADSLAFSLN
jgi:ATP-dependent Clp protease ATP-binding subunit ClpA